MNFEFFCDDNNNIIYYYFIIIIIIIIIIIVIEKFKIHRSPFSEIEKQLQQKNLTLNEKQLQQKIKHALFLLEDPWRRK
jgi:sensor domain CHASE-containing protein